MTTKVKNTELYENSLGKYLVCEGKIVELYMEIEGAFEINNKWVAMLIISETEEIQIGDNAIGLDNKIIKCNESNHAFIQEHWKKILVMPDQFAYEHVQFLLLELGFHNKDYTFVECEKIVIGGSQNPFNKCYHKIKLDNNNFVTLVANDKKHPEYLKQRK